MAYHPEYELKTFTKRRTQTVLRVGSEGTPDEVHGTLVLALYSRETNLRNVCGGAIFDAGKIIPTKSDRGLAQINEFYWKNWLDSHKGCPEGTYGAEWDSCLPAGRVPRLTDQTRFVCDRLSSLIVDARLAGMEFPIAVALSAYNCGFYFAVKGAKEYGDSDHYTARGPYKLNGEYGDYSKDILLRQKEIRRWIQRNGWTL